MTDRERWIVYPLLFLALGAGVKDKILDRTDIETVVCENLVVHDHDGKQQVVISSSPVGGQVVTLGSKNAVGVLVGHTEKLAGLMFVDGRGRLIRSLATMPTSVAAPPGANQPGREPPEQPPAEHPSEERPPEQPDGPIPEQSSPK